MGVKNTQKKWNVVFWGQSEAAVRMCSVKKVFKEISQNSQENICDRVSFLIKLQPEPATLFKKRLWHRCFPVNFAKFLRTPFLTEHLQWLLLSIAEPLISLSCGLMFSCCLSQQHGLQIIWQFWHVNNRQISIAGVLFTVFSDVFKW